MGFLADHKLGGGVSKVTQYTATLSTAATNVTISSVDQTSTYLILTTNSSGSSGSSDTIAAAAEFTSNTNVLITRGDAAQNADYVLQVVEN